MQTEKLQNKESTKSEQNICQPMANVCQWMANVHPAVALVWLSPFQVLYLHKTVHWIELTSPDKEHICQMRNRQETHMDIQKRIGNYVLCQTTINTIWLGVTDP